MLSSDVSAHSMYKDTVRLAGRQLTPKW